MEDATRIALRYVPQFVCLANDCRENCCSGLRVELTKDNHEHLVQRAAGSPVLSEQVSQIVRIERADKRSARNYAFVDAAGKTCPFLDADWLCSIQRSLGEDALADPCSLFPRVLAESHGRRELSASFACPEAARLCLTVDGAVDLVPYEPGAMAREIVVRRHDGQDTDAYVALLDDIRDACLAVMNTDGVRPPVRLLLLADFAERVEPFFHAKSTSFDMAALRAAIELIPERAGAMQALFEGAAVADRRALRAMKEILIARVPNCENARFNVLVRPLVLKDVDATREAVVGYFAGGSEVAREVARDVALDDETMHARYQQAHARLFPIYQAHLDEQARRYAINSIVKDWYTLRPTLSSSLRRLVLRLALSRFTMTMHQTLTTVSAADPQRGRSLLDDAAVDAFQIVSKNIEHTPSFMDLCEGYLREQHLDGPAGLALLLRL